ncbi:MAG TPA: hypothetical protein VFD43_06300, partial [Planctomycetota bacterium]|nr:hypothetical protein [Planctomycetota bacterium]
NLWLVDRDHAQMMRFTTSGKLLRTLGTKGFRSDTGVPPDYGKSDAWKYVTHGGGPFNLPTDIDLNPAGEMFVTDGYGNARVHKFAADGTHLMSWGEPGAGPGQFNLPHAVWIARDGRVLVADRENDRVQVFDQNGKLLRIWPTKLIGPAVIYVDREDIVYIGPAALRQACVVRAALEAGDAVARALVEEHDVPDELAGQQPRAGRAVHEHEIQVAVAVEIDEGGPVAVHLQDRLLVGRVAAGQRHVDARRGRALLEERALAAAGAEQREEQRAGERAEERRGGGAGRRHGGAKIGARPGRRQCEPARLDSAPCSAIPGSRPWRWPPRAGRAIRCSRSRGGT